MKNTYLVKAWDKKTEQYLSYFIIGKSDTHALQRAFKLCVLKKTDFNQMDYKYCLDPYSKQWV